MRPVRAPGWPTAGTGLLALLGWPAAHSLSPVMHNAALADQGVDLVYVALPTRPADLAAAVAGLGAVGARGANVTVPHKQAVVGLCTRLTAEAELVGAVNTLVWEASGLLGHNTDADGLVRTLTGDVGIGATSACMLGTGGAARAAAVALGRMGCEVAVVGRRPAAAADVAGLVARAGGTATAVDLADNNATAAAVETARLVVNATPLGMDGERLPEPFMALRGHQTAYDLVYRPPDTPFLRAAGAAGAEAHHGLGMLVAQAALAYERWTGRPAPRGVMSAAATAALVEGR